MQEIDFKEISGVVVKSAKKNIDSRGWLIECFRQDTINKENIPAMSYMSMTYPGVVRGPHEHLTQTDYFCFLGASTFKFYLWDNRKESSTFRKMATILIQEDNPLVIIIPPRIVHAYKNTGDMQGLVLNYPNKLYAGVGRKGKVDEVRYEHDANSPFKID